MAKRKPVENGILSYALIPAYEPGAILEDLARELNDSGFSVVIVDDGSGDGYAGVFKNAEKYAKVISYVENRGKGYALKAGLSYIARQGASGAVVVTLDADGQHRVGDALRVRDEALWRRKCLVLGSRRICKDTPLKSRFGNTVTRFVFKLSTGKKVYDTQTGLRAFGVDMIPFMQEVTGDRYEYEMNVLLNCARTNIPIHEVVIETIYFDRNTGTHFNALTDSFRVYGEIIKFAASSLTGFLVDYGTYILLVVMTSGLGTGVGVPLSNICARVISASVNYTINRKFVFKNKDGVIKTAAMYFGLAFLILAGNTLLLTLMVQRLGINKYAAKIITEIIFFTLSWLAQKLIVFRGKEHGPRKAGTEKH